MHILGIMADAAIAQLARTLRPAVHGRELAGGVAQQDPLQLGTERRQMLRAPPALGLVEDVVPARTQRKQHLVVQVGDLAVLEVLGVSDVVAKSKGSSNPYNMVRATIEDRKSVV